MARRRRGSLAGLAATMATLGLLVPGLAQATPSQDDIDQAQAAADAAKMSVAQIEVELASATSQAQQATQAAQVAAEDLNQSKIELEEATATATQAKADAEKAQSDYEAGKKELASVAQTAYREGGSSLDALTPYLESDGLSQVELKQSTLETFGSAADAKMQRVAALEQVARIMSDAADKAQAAQEAATAEVQTRTDAAQSAAESAVSLQTQTQERRQVLVNELAKRENTTADLIEQRESALEAQRQAAAKAEAERAAAEVAQQQAAAAGGGSSAGGGGSSSGGGSTGGGGNTGGGGGYVPDPEPVTPVPSGGGSAAQGAIAWAKSQIGWPYVWAGEGPGWGGYDCSGLVMMAYRSQGIYLPHSSAAQYNYGYKVPLSQRQPGDLLFWSNGSSIYHVAMSLGGDSIIEAQIEGVPVGIHSIWGWGQLMPYVVRLA
ncbi:MAG: C40 family peptidase [Actinomyces sp.]|jgi:cell wall-associated NlpC family hydrolase|nr:C40 family peptidase [Actinomyces sp.]MCI1642752.1 C40 family peptidase [Actinomyces sp.]MCI1662811.1 C40 family peptidase [Actinomyces sp.]MCI1691901.1 C40 family peptidase [Actinomyces sp.]MCI1787823.1 C40 family peptidase [Actinomyces sp.]MCI1829841.1 C40 family peptidase [Actinomyces sp.]